MTSGAIWCPTPLSYWFALLLPLLLTYSVSTLHWSQFVIKQQFGKKLDKARENLWLGQVCIQSVPAAQPHHLLAISQTPRSPLALRMREFTLVSRARARALQSLAAHNRRWISMTKTIIPIFFCSSSVFTSIVWLNELMNHRFNKLTKYILIL